MAIRNLERNSELRMDHLRHSFSFSEDRSSMQLPFQRGIRQKIGKSECNHATKRTLKFKGTILNLFNEQGSLEREQSKAVFENQRRGEELGSCVAISLRFRNAGSKI